MNQIYCIRTQLSARLKSEPREAALEVLRKRSQNMRATTNHKNNPVRILTTETGRFRSIEGELLITDGNECVQCSSLCRQHPKQRSKVKVLGELVGLAEDTRW